MVNPESIHTSNIIHTKQTVLKYLVIYMNYTYISAYKEMNMVLFKATKALNNNINIININNNIHHECLWL